VVRDIFKKTVYNDDWNLKKFILHDILLPQHWKVTQEIEKTVDEKS
jgi:hypothetical protein